MKTLDYLAPIALVASLVALGLAPLPVYLGAFITAVAFFAAERVRAELGASVVARKEAAAAAEKYVAELAAFRHELKVVRDAAAQAINASTRRSGF